MIGTWAEEFVYPVSATDAIAQGDAALRVIWLFQFGQARLNPRSRRSANGRRARKRRNRRGYAVICLYLQYLA
jgi:hypothetical protein